MPNVSITLPESYVVASRGVNVQVDVNTLPADIVAKLALHGLGQKIGDSAASAMADAGFAGRKFDELSDDEKTKVRDMAKAAMTGTLESLVAGEWSERKPGEVVDPLVARTRTVFGAWLRANAADVWKANFKTLEAADRGKALDTFLADQGEEFVTAMTDTAKAELADEAARAKKLAKLAIKVAVPA